MTPHTRSGSGDTPLHAAIWAGDDEAARLLIDAGADVNAAGEDGYTPIHAALAQSNVPLARRLTACGASWDAVNAFACSVRDAARRSDDPAVRALLEQEELVSQLPGRIGHFRLESGHHSDLWIDSFELLCLRPEFVRQRAAELAGASREPSRGRCLRPSCRGGLRRAAGRHGSRRRVLLHGALRAAERRPGPFDGLRAGAGAVSGGVTVCRPCFAGSCGASAWRLSTT